VPLTMDATAATSAGEGSCCFLDCWGPKGGAAACCTPVEERAARLAAAAMSAGCGKAEPAR
jgi:hypothetical protein